MFVIINDKKYEGECIDDIIEGLIDKKIIYWYNIGNEISHTHSWESLLKILINNYSDFSITGFEQYYSNQQIDILHKLRDKIQVL